MKEIVKAMHIGRQPPGEDARTAVRAASRLLVGALLCSGCVVKGVLGDGLVGQLGSSGVGAGSTGGATVSAGGGSSGAASSGTSGADTSATTSGGTSGSASSTVAGSSGGGSSAGSSESTTGSGGTQGSTGSSSSGGPGDTCPAPTATSAPDLPITAGELALSSGDAGTALVYGVLSGDQLSSNFFLQQVSAAGQAVGQPIQLGSQTSQDVTTLSLAPSGAGFVVCWSAADVGLSCSAADFSGSVTPGFAGPGDGVAVTSGPGGDWAFYDADGGIFGQPLQANAQAAAGAVSWAMPGVEAGTSGTTLAAAGVDSGYAVFWLGLTEAQLWWLDVAGAQTGSSPVALQANEVDAQLAMAASGDAVLLTYLTELDDVQGFFQLGASGTVAGPFELSSTGAVMANGVAAAGSLGAFGTAWPDPTLSYRAVSGLGIPVGTASTPGQPGNSGAPMAMTAVPGGFLVAAQGIETNSGNQAIFLTSFACP